jgi:translocation and assembly module TamA
MIRLARPVLAALLSSTLLVCVAAPAQAFEIFGFKLFGSKDDADEDIADPLNYTVTLQAPLADGSLTDKLNASSRLVSDEERPVSGSLGLLTKARSDRERLVAALYEEARYDGVVDVLIDGRSVDSLPADAEFGAGPVPVVITVDPGQVFTIGQVRLAGDAAGLEPSEFGLDPGGPAGSVRILKAEAAIVKRLKEDGRPLAKVADQGVVADHATGMLDVTIDVAAGPVAGYGPTSVAGTQDVDRDFTRYMTGLVEGRRYSPEEVDDARERLVDLGVFSSVSVKEAEALDAAGNIPMHVEVSERKPRYFGAGATLSNTDGGGLEGYWGHRNLFGRAEKLRIEGSISRLGATTDINQLNYNAGIMFEKPGVVGPSSRFFAALKTVYEHPDAYDRFSVKASTGLAYDLTKRQSVSAELAVDYSRITDTFQTRRDYLIVSTPLQYVYDSRDNKLNPASGVRLLAFAEPSYDVLASKPFLKLRGEGSTYLSLDRSNRFVVAGRAAIGSIVGADVDEIPADRRFYVGGGGSVRGYAYQGIGPKDAKNQPTGGLSYAEASAELRIGITDTIGIVPFIDAGTASTKQFPSFSDIKVGAGVGLRYLTPFGPLRIDAAIPLNREPTDPRFGIYAGVGQAF